MPERERSLIVVCSLVAVEGHAVCVPENSDKAVVCLGGSKHSTCLRGGESEHAKKLLSSTPRSDVEVFSWSGFRRKMEYGGG